ncbi:MAG: hypothetical protein JXP34_15970 [Planctomycetes bacterium]|nr:hypothetical protein [Planctomycetota bacterium]
MRARILGAESLGVRSLAVLVEATWGKVLVDPGVSLAPERFGRPPHPRELAASFRAVRERAGAGAARCAAEVEGLAPEPLEARRRRLYDEEPVPDGWHAAFEAGDETIRREIARRSPSLRAGFGPLLADGPPGG